jgi:glycosyltransferase involved in cell wall biosynthesis
MNKDLVSVIICVYNSSAFIAEAIESVLKQDYPKIELIVVNDGSSDNSAGIATRYSQVKLLSHATNQGLPSARNTGIKAASGEYIAFLDADDQWAPTKISTQVKFHRDNLQFKYSFTLERFVYENSIEQPNWTKKQVLKEDHIAYCAGSMLFEHTLFHVIGPFNPEYINGDATEWIFRAKDQGYFGGIVPEVLLFRRIHVKNLSSNVDQEMKALLQVVKDSMSRQKNTRKSNE